MAEMSESTMSRLENMSGYFQLAVNIFHKYSWIYDFKATEILFDHVLERIPIEFQNIFRGFQDTDSQFHQVLNLQENEDWPKTVRDFIKDCNLLKVLSEGLKNRTTDQQTSFQTFEPPVDVSKVMLPKKWNQKKYFEVMHVGNFVGQVASQEECDVVVDIGSGLGYLSSHLSTQFRIPVIGVESESSRVRTAQSIYEETKQKSSTAASQTFVCLRITEKMSDELNPHVSQCHRVCLTALHACGDLTPWSLKYFVNSSACQVVAIVPCCYHKMDKDTCNFPMSNSLKKALSEYDDINFLRNPWLWRLASQRAGSKFLNDIRKETRNLFYRAILERFINQENLTLQRSKRKANDLSFEGFQQYLEKTIGSSSGIYYLIRLHEDGSSTKLDLNEISSTIQKLRDEFYSWELVVTGILALQGAIQIIAEEFILLDRVRFMEESGLVKSAGILRVIPESVSPRGMVLFGIKNSTEEEGE